MTPARTLAMLSAAALAVGIGVWSFSSCASAQEVGKPAPEVSAADWFNSDGKAVSLKGLKGKVVVVEFWATWCPPCRTAIPHLVKLYEENKAKGLVMVSLSDEPKAKVEPFMKQYKMSYIVGAGSKTIAQYGVRGIPAAFVLDREGSVVWSGHPMSPQFTATVKKLLEAASQ
jgi:thiol-disulfide isomerase/thioredoxin